MPVIVFLVIYFSVALFVMNIWIVKMQNMLDPREKLSIWSWMTAAFVSFFWIIIFPLLFVLVLKDFIEEYRG